MFAKLKEKTGSTSLQKSPAINQERSKLKADDDAKHLQSIHESSIASSEDRQFASEGAPSILLPGKISRQSSVSSMVSDMSMISTSQFVNDSPMPNIDAELGGFDVEDTALPVLSSDLSPQDVYSSLVRDSRQKLNFAKFKYQDLLTAYHELEKQNVKVKDALAKSQDRAFKKIAELKENEKIVRLELDKCQQRISVLEEEQSNDQAVTFQEERNTFQARISELEAALAATRSEQESSRVSQEKLSASISSFQSEKSRLEDGLKIASDKILELKKNLSEKDTIHSLALAECKRSFHALLEERDDEIKRCRTQMEHYSADVEAAKKQAEEIASSVTALKSENVKLHKSLESTERRVEEEKIQIVQEVSKAKDAACEALQVDFDKKVAEHRQNWEREVEKKIAEVESIWQKRLSETIEQSKLALEESWMSRKAAVSKHEEELDAAQTRISQLSVELDSARMALHRRTVEADQLRTAQNQLSLQSTADIEQAVMQCRREMEAQHRSELKALREEQISRREEPIDAPVLVDTAVDSMEITNGESEKVHSPAKAQEELDSLWSRVKSEIDLTDLALVPDITSFSDVLDFVLTNSIHILRVKAAYENLLRTEREKVAESTTTEVRSSFEQEMTTLRNSTNSLQQCLNDESQRAKVLEVQVEELTTKLSEMQILRDTNEALRQEALTQAAQVQTLENRLAQLTSELEQVPSLKLENESQSKKVQELTDQMLSLANETDQLKVTMNSSKNDLLLVTKQLASLLPENSDQINHNLSSSEIIARFVSFHSELKGKLVSLIEETKSHAHITEELRSALKQSEVNFNETKAEQEKQLKSIAEERDSCRLQLAEEIKRNAEMKHALDSTEAESRSQVVNLEEVVRRLTQDSQELQHKLTSTVEELQAERLRFSAVTADYQALTSVVENLRLQHDSAIKEFAQKEKHLIDDQHRVNEELKASNIEVRRLETKFGVLETELADAKMATQNSGEKHELEIRNAEKVAENLKTKCATLEMDLMECRQKLTLSQELLGKLKAELESSRKLTEEAQQKFATLKTQSAKRLKGIADEKCELEKQLASSLAEVDALKSQVSQTNDDLSKSDSPSADELQKTIAELTCSIESMSKTVADKEMRIAELELEMNDVATKHSADIQKMTSDHEKQQAEWEQRARFEMKRAVADFERQVTDRDKQISKLTVAETAREARTAADPERQLRSFERELSEKNAAVEQLVVMYEKQLRDQAAELRQEATSRMQSLNEKHQAEVDGLMEEFRNETKQWVVERQKLSEEVDNCRRDREQMVQELKRLSELLDSARNSATPPRPGRDRFPADSSFLTPALSAPNHSSVLVGSASPALSTSGTMQLHEATEYEYLRNILLEYMVGRETSVLWRVIATVMRFSEEQMQEIAAHENEKHHKWL